MHHLFKLRLPRGGPFIFVLSTFIIMFAAPFLAPSFPLFMKGLFGSDAAVGYATAGIMFIYLLSNLLVGKVLERISRMALLKITAFIYFLSLIILIFITNVYQFFAIEAARGFAGVAITIAIGLLIRENVDRTKIGKIEGWYYVVANLAFLVGPLFGGLFAAKYGFSGVFLIASIFPLVFFLTLFSEKLKEKQIKFRHSHSWKEVKEFFKRKYLLSVYLLNMALMIWWGFIYTFVPLYLTEYGYSQAEIGYVLCALVIPLVLLEIPAGKWSDRYGCKKFLILGFALLGLFALIGYFVSVELSVWCIILASIGAAFIEPLLETYFFKKLSEKDEIRFYPVYKTSLEIGRIVGLLVFSSLLLYFNFNSLFLFIGIVLLGFAIFTKIFLRE